MTRSALAFALIAAVTRSGAVAAQPAPGAPATAQRPPPYLPADALPDPLSYLPPAPAVGSAQDRADVAIYQSTRALQGGPRWTLATHDAETTPTSVLADFDCALGAQLDPAALPAMVKLIARAGRTDSLAVDRAKDHWRRPRPFVGNTLPICVPREGKLAASWSYPSGHATYGWTTGLILAELAPDRAGPVLTRARVYGESRVVCGVHYASDVEEGRVNASAVFAALQGSPEFQADLTAARAELAAARAHAAAPDPGQCRIESEAARTPW